MTKKKNDTEQEYFDPLSGETVSSPSNRTPENYGTTKNEIIYLGFSKLLDFGATKHHVEATKVSLKRFSEKGEKPITEVSVSVSSIRQNGINTSTGKREIVFSIMLNREKKIEATIEYDSIVDSRLILRDGGKVVFDSGVVGPDGLYRESVNTDIDEYSGD